MKWRVVLETDIETGDWSVWCPELPGCVSAGETEAEALENIREASELYLEPDPIESKIRMSDVVIYEPDALADLEKL